MKATRRADAADGTKMRFVFDGLMRVSFTPLVGQACSEPHPSPGQRLALQGPRWGAAPPQAFPPSFINVAVTPWDVWSLHILPCLAHDAFEKQGPAHAHAPTLTPTHLPAELPAYPPPPPPPPPPGHDETAAAAQILLAAGAENGYEAEAESEP